MVIYIIVYTKMSHVYSIGYALYLKYMKDHIPTPMKTILIPTDFSQNAESALKYALKFIGDAEARLHIINVITPVVLSAEVPLSGDVTGEQMQFAKESLSGIKSLCNKMLGKQSERKISITTHIKVGGVSHMIKEEAEKESVDMIMMGTQGSNHSKIDKLVGTVSTDAIDNAPCPVLLIPMGYEFVPIDNLIFPTNLNHQAPYELWKAIEVIKPNMTTVRCLFISKDLSKEDSQELDQFATYITERSPSLQTFFDMEESNSIEETIAEYAENYDAELVVMHHSKKSIWKRIFEVRHTKRVANLLKVPLLILNA